jgi:hypothetical protein
MEIQFLPPAKSELMDAISYYNMQSEGLGYDFAAEVKRTIERIIQYPDAWSAVITYRSGKIRIISVRRSRKEDVDIYES